MSHDKHLRCSFCGKSAAELRASLEKAKRLRDLERGLTEEKVFTFLLSQSTVEPV